MFDLITFAEFRNKTHTAHPLFLIFFLYRARAMSIRMEDFIEPPTEASLADARRVLVATQASVAAVKAELDAAEAALARVVQESRARIGELETRRGELAQTVTHAMAYLSPIRRLPLELLRNIFIECFDEHPCCAWVLAAVCGPWRRLVLRMPKIWSRVCFLFYFPMSVLTCAVDSSSHDTARLGGHDTSVAGTLRGHCAVGH